MCVVRLVWRWNCMTLVFLVYLAMGRWPFHCTILHTVNKSWVSQWARAGLCCYASTFADELCIFVRRFLVFVFLNTSSIWSGLLQCFAISEFFPFGSFAVRLAKSATVCLISFYIWVRIILVLWLPAWFSLYRFLCCTPLPGLRTEKTSVRLCLTNYNTLSLSCNCP